MKAQIELNDCLMLPLIAHVENVAATQGEQAARREFMRLKERVSNALRFSQESNYIYWNRRFHGRQVG